MLAEYYIDLQDDTGQIGITALRCAICGEVVDQVILENRVGPAPNLLYGTRGRKYAQRVDQEDKEPKANGRTDDSDGNQKG